MEVGLIKTESEERNFLILILIHPQPPAFNCLPLFLR